MHFKNEEAEVRRGPVTSVQTEQPVSKICAFPYPLPLSLSIENLLMTRSWLIVPSLFFPFKLQILELLTWSSQRSSVGLSSGGDTSSQC